MFSYGIRTRCPSVRSTTIHEPNRIITVNGNDTLLVNRNARSNRLPHNNVHWSLDRVDDGYESSSEGDCGTRKGDAKLSRTFLIKTVAICVGYLLSLIAILLPWRVRNKYSDLLGFLIGVSLRSKMVLDFFMNIGFKGLETKTD